MTQAEPNEAQSEILALRARVAELERQLAERAPAGPPAPREARPTAAPPDQRAWLAAALRAIVAWRMDGAVTRWSPGAERLFGWREEEALGSNLAELLGDLPVGPDEQRALGEETRDRAAMRTVERAVRTRDGRSIRCRWTCAATLDARGAPHGVVAEAEHIDDRDQIERTLRGRLQLLSAVVDRSPSMIFVKDREHRYVLVNRALSEAYGAHPLAVIGLTDLEFGLDPEASETFVQKDLEVLAGGRPVQFEEVVPLGTPRNFITIKFPIHDENGEAIGLCGIATEVTELKRAEAERAALQDQVIAAQRAALRELSTPIVPVADQVLVMPLVGSIDDARAEQIMQSLLDAISQQSAHTAILDITGVREVDARTAAALARAAGAARLLGARVVLTGIRPEVARVLVELGAELGDVVTRSTLQSGIAHALRRNPDAVG